MKIKIIADSGANLKTLPHVPFASVPLKIVTDAREFSDDIHLDVTDMVEFLKTYRGKSGSACPSVQDYLDAYGDAEYLFVFTITGNLSGSHNAARLAKEDYEAAYPDRHVCVVDTLSAGPEMNLLIEKTEALIQEGVACETIEQELKAYGEHTRLLFCLESMQNLANNGRCSHAVAKLAGLLGMRAVGRASEQGELEMLDKCRGEKKTLMVIAKHMKTMGYHGGKLRIDHCENLATAEQLKANILAEFPNADIIIGKTYGLCSFYAEKGGLMIGFEI